MILDYLFVGAGPANLVAANYFLDAGENNLLVLDQGKDLIGRYCPTVASHTCVRCRYGCDVIQGVGGTAALFGNKFCYFPASSAILESFDDRDIFAAFHYLDWRLSPYFDSRLNSFQNSSSSQEKKKYSSTIISLADFACLIERLAARLRGVDALRTNSCVQDVALTAQGRFSVATSRGDIYETRSLVIGTGRSAYKLNHRLFHDLGVEVCQGSQDVGIRIEAPLKFFSQSYHYQIDPKFKREYAIGSARTFCGEPRGRVVPVRLGEAFYAEGAYTADTTELSNIALVARTIKSISTNDLEIWCHLINEHCGGRLELASVAADNPAWKRELIDVVAGIPLWPKRQHRDILLKFMTDIIGEILSPSTGGPGSLKLYAPSVDRYWPQPMLKHNLGTSVPGLYVLGDAAGLSRGFVQAFFSGAAWAVSQCRELCATGEVCGQGEGVWSASV